MPSGDLETMNLLLGILAAVSVLEALAVLLASVIGHGTDRLVEDISGAWAASAHSKRSRVA